MTYKELLETLQKLPEERLLDTVTVYEPYDDEYVAVIDTFDAISDVLDEGHLVLNLKG